MWSLFSTEVEVGTGNRVRMIGLAWGVLDASDSLSLIGVELAVVGPVEAAASATFLAIDVFLSHWFGIERLRCMAVGSYLLSSIFDFSDQDKLLDVITFAVLFSL